MTEPIRIDRRGLFAGAALAGAAFGLGLAGPAAAAAPTQGVRRPGFYRFRLGEFEVTSILDGAVQLDGPQPIFGEDAAAADVASLAAENFLPVGRMEIVFNVTVVNTGSQVIVFDTGNGMNGFVPRPDAGRLREMLAATGIAPDRVDLVALTHCHPDHIGGLMEAGAPAFPNASYALGATEYDFWSKPALVDDPKFGQNARLVQANLVPLAPKARFLGDGDALVPGITAMASNGHTPGHLSYHVESAGQRLLILGDVSNHYVMSLQRPDWHVVFDVDREMAVATRKRVLGMIAADRIPFLGYHMPPPAVGYLEAKGAGFRFVPVSYQLNL